MKMTPNLTEALELAKTDRFSGARLRALKALYDSADAPEKPVSYTHLTLPTNSRV